VPQLPAGLGAGDAARRPQTAPQEDRAGFPAPLLGPKSAGFYCTTAGSICKRWRRRV